MAKTAKSLPEGFHTLTPQLTLDDAAQTIDWYKRAFGMEEIRRGLGPDGKIMNAELKLGNSRFMVNDPMPGLKGPASYGGSPAALWIYVDDSDALFNRAVKAGAKEQIPMDNQFWGDRAGAVADPAGYTWWIATHKEELTDDEIQERATNFFQQSASQH